MKNHSNNFTLFWYTFGICQVGAGCKTCGLYIGIHDFSIIKNDIKFDLSGIESVFMQADN